MGEAMVKGISRRVIVVRAENSAVFEEAFFVVRDAAASEHDVVREACAVAERYLGARGRRLRRKFTGAQLALSAGAGGALASAVWAAALWLV